MADLQHHPKPLTPNHIQQSQRRPPRLLHSTLQLRDIPHSKVEIPGERRLAQPLPLPQRANLLAADRLGDGGGLRLQLAMIPAIVDATPANELIHAVLKMPA